MVNATDSNDPVVAVEVDARNEDAADPVSAWIGRIVGKRHRIVRHVASGGMAQVFLAQHVVLGGYVAVKVLNRDSQREVVELFATEAKLLSRLRHPNIVGVFDCGVLPAGGYYIVMEWLPGDDLGSFVETNGPLPRQRALWVLRQLSIAIDHIHRLGIVHRDIKGANVIFLPEANDAVKLFDFGVASRISEAPATQTPRQIVGTPMYMAPEQALGELGTVATDLYSFAALALEVLTGKPAYAERTPTETLTAILTSPPALPSDNGLDVPGLDSVMSRALARHPNRRFESAEAFVHALEDVLSPGGAVPMEPSGAREVRPSTASVQQATARRVRPRPVRLRLNDLDVLPQEERRRGVTALGIVAAFLCGAVAWLASVQ